VAVFALNLLEVHSMNFHAQFYFNWPNGFREDDGNV